MTTPTPGPLVTVSHSEEADLVRSMGGELVLRAGLDVTAEIVYAPGQSQAALAAVDRLAASLRRQIADAAESGPR